MKLTKISTTDLFKTDGGISKIISLNITNFGQLKKVYFHRDSGKNSPFSALLSGKKGRFLTKSQGKYFWGTAGNPVLRKHIIIFKNTREQSKTFVSFL